MNIEKYNKLHDEIMKRLENGEITMEQAKEVNDLAFDKYIVMESTDISKSRKDILNTTLKMLREAKIKYIEYLDDDKEKLISGEINIGNIAVLNFRPHIKETNGDMSFTIEPTELLMDTIEKINAEIKPHARLDCDGNPKDMEITIEF